MQVERVNYLENERKRLENILRDKASNESDSRKEIDYLLLSIENERLEKLIEGRSKEIEYIEGMLRESKAKTEDKRNELRQLRG